ncbi:MAG: hypothetical protein OEV87_01400 [Phycisphaerae bacterium]|nr:hypothetical protein [Phycisphaerae bacterium]
MKIQTTQLMVIVFILCIPILRAEILYDIIDLGTLGGSHSEAYSINNQRQVVGWSYTIAGLSHATLFDSSGQQQNNIDLGTYGVTESKAYSINDLGNIVGSGSRAILFDSTGAGNNISLGVSVGTQSYALSINNHNRIVGWSGYKATEFDFSGTGNNINLGTTDSTVSYSYSMNDNGQIVGQRTGYAAIFDYDNGSIISLGDLGGGQSCAYSNNNNNQVAGYAWTATGKTHATLFDMTGGNNNIDLGTVGTSANDNESMAFSINNMGQIVGRSGVYGFRRAALFDASGNGNNIDLNTLIDNSLGWNLIEARDINDNGWIVGYGINPNGEHHAYLLTPIPEPTTFSLLTVGVLLLRRKK